MEIKAKLNKPYTEHERINFIVEYNHKKGFKINEVVEGLEALGYTEEELSQQEQEKIAMLSLTGADVERAIYKAKGLDFDDILDLVKDKEYIDIKALKIELKANNFYRGNPYVEQIGTLLGFTSEDLNYLFEYKELPVTVRAEND